MAVPVPGPNGEVFPTQQDVARAEAAVTTAEQDVTGVQAAYGRASERLAGVRARESFATEAYNRARISLDAATERVEQAEAASRAARADAASADRRVRRYAAQMYTDQGGLADVEAYLSSAGPQQLADRSATLDALGHANRQALDAAADRAHVATEATRLAQRARVQLRDAAEQAEMARAAAAVASANAAAEATAIEAEQRALLTRLAELQDTSVAIQQARQDGLARVAAAEEAARKAAAEKAAAEQRAREAREAADRAAAEQAAREAAEREAAAKAAAERETREAAAREAKLRAEAAAKAKQEAAEKAKAAKKTATAAPRAPEQASRSDTRAPATTPAPAPAATVPAGSGGMDEVIAYARAQIGKQYVWGGEGPNGFDCSGLVMMAYRQIGINLPHSSSMQYVGGTKVPLSQLRPGDLVFYGASGETNHHVGIFIGNGQMINALNSRAGIRIDSIYLMSDLLPNGARY